jgi:excisionase family DNA binding protein
MTFPDPVSVEDLAAALIKALTEAGITYTPEDPNKLFTPSEAAVILGITRSSLYKLRLEKRWPHHLLGGAIRFSRGDLDAILASTAKTPEPPRRTRSRLR